MSIHKDTVGDLKLSIKSNQQKFAIGESIFVEVTIENLSTESILIRQFLLLPADDPRNGVKFEITDDKRQQLKRISHTMTGRNLVQPWEMIEALGEKQTYTRTFQLSGMYQRKSNKKTYLKPLWSLGETLDKNSLNEYPIQQKGKYKIYAVYHNTDDGRNWPEQFWDRKQKVWIGELISNTIEIEVFK